ncbi:MAG: hypothetical protein KGQ52_10315 [Alphaproteobacteria bacterium]|nr:hypothetical protein [Alphaproteobacteria bacterium]
MRIALLLAVLATPATATEVVRLTDAQRDAVITAAANGPERPAVLTPLQAARPSVLDRPLYPEFFAADGPPINDRRVHGEMTMFAGSGGTFGVAGTAVLPVGNSGSAALSFMQGTSRFGPISGFGFGFATGAAGRNLAADISNPGLFQPGFAGFGPGLPPRRRRR